ncbi:MAG: glutathione S-transferase family protein [Gammaproteobacteria bacterium]|nr:glutathione S-transferase family protein [Gammaproteobacteria bacterium]
MKLYHCKDSRSLRPLWTLDEMGLECELINMEFPPRLTEPEYLTVNPLGTVPAFIDGNLTMTESTAICHYLVEKYGPTSMGMTINEPGYGEYLNWLYRSDATLTFPQTLVLRYSRFEPPERRLPQVVTDYSQWYLSRLRAVESALDGQQFLCGNRFTIADVAVGYALFLGQTLGLDEHYKPRCKDYLCRLMERPAFIRARAH